MNAYRFSYEGMWLGGTIIVIAPNKEIAEKLVKEKLSKNDGGIGEKYINDNLKSLELEEEMSIVQARVIFDWDGNY